MAVRRTLGQTTAEAHAKFNALQALLDPLVGLSTLLREHLGLKPAVSQYARASGPPAAG